MRSLSKNSFPREIRFFRRVAQQSPHSNECQQAETDWSELAQSASRFQPVQRLGTLWGGLSPE